jgi:hypothetical protein
MLKFYVENSHTAYGNMVTAKQLKVVEEKP